MRWVICIWSGPSMDGLDPHLALNAAMPSMDPRMACHGHARHGSHAIRGWSMPSADGTDPYLAPNRSYLLNIHVHYYHLCITSLSIDILGGNSILFRITSITLHWFGCLNSLRCRLESQQLNI